MKISKISIYKFPTCLKFSFSHSLFTRSDSVSFICILTDHQGLRGYGEGVPRPYVTGEELEDSESFVCELAHGFVGLHISCFEDLKDKINSLLCEKFINKFPAACCSIEIALLDLWAKAHGIPLWRLFRDKPSKEIFSYSGVIPLASGQRLNKILDIVKRLKLSSLKVKINGNNDNQAWLSFLRKTMGADVDLRVDANGCFSPEEAIGFLQKVEKIGITSVEQPVPKNDIKGLQETAQKAKIPVLADESLYTPDGPEYIIDHRICHGLNLRISSCGGFLRSLRLLKKAELNGMICQIGSHVGETSLLAAAARHLASVCNNVTHLEGSSSRYLLEEDLANKDISFGEYGHAPILKAPGLGLDFNEHLLKRLGSTICSF